MYVTLSLFWCHLTGKRVYMYLVFLKRVLGCPSFLAQLTKSLGREVRKIPGSQENKKSSCNLVSGLLAWLDRGRITGEGLVKFNNLVLSCNLIHIKAWNGSDELTLPICQYMYLSCKYVKYNVTGRAKTMSRRRFLPIKPVNLPALSISRAESAGRETRLNLLYFLVLHIWLKFVRGFESMDKLFLRRILLDISGNVGTTLSR